MSNKIKHIIFLSYILFGLILLYFHEPWRDEANTWLIVKNLNIIELFDEIRVDGNPCFYYLFLFPFAKLGLPYFFNNFISFIISIITAYLLIFKTKLNNILIFLMLFSSLFIYYGGIFGRSYCMVNLLFLLLTIFYKNRINYPIIYGFLIALLFNTHIMLFGFCLGLLIVSCYDYFKTKQFKRKKFDLFGLIIQFSGMLFLIFQLYGCIGMNEDVSVVHRSTLFIFLFIFISIILFIYVILEKSKIYYIIYFGFLAQLIGVFFISHLSPYIFNLLFLNIIFLLNNCSFKKKILFDILFIMLFILIDFFCDFPRYRRDIFYQYSDSVSTSMYIRDNIHLGNKILCVPEYLCISVLANVPQFNFYNLFGDKLIYMNYKNFGNDRSIDINQYLNAYKFDYVIIGNNYKHINGNYQLIYSTDEKVIIGDESFKIYKYIE